MLSPANRLGVGEVGLVEGRIGIGGDFTVSRACVGGFGVFGIHDCASECFPAWLQSRLGSECSNHSNARSLLYAVGMYLSD